MSEPRSANGGSSTNATQTNLVRQRAFSERIRELMNQYTNQQLTSAEVIAGLIKLGNEVGAEANRGQHFEPPLDSDELAFYDAVASNESAVQMQGEGVLAQIARELVAVMRRDVKRTGRCATTCAPNFGRRSSDRW
jgi:type I restriction enzyme R subunit